MSKNPAEHDDIEAPRRYVLEERIKFIAAESDRVTISNHAEDRMIERDITTNMMFRVLRGGTLEGDIKQGRKPGNWEAKMVHSIPGHREVGVVTAVLQSDRLVVITVEWEDWRSR
ncbi:MAG: DUF4258 domain-containing protein [Pseudomonadota bacterium]